MRAMVLEKQKTPLKLKELDIPKPGKGQVLIKVHACGVCRTDLHVFDGELPDPNLPLILGHQIVGVVVETAGDAEGFKKGDRVGVPWLQGACGHCRFCLTDRENLCNSALYTGYHLNGGFAEYCTADHRFVFLIPNAFSDEQAAPLLCAGFIGYRALRMVGGATSIGFYGFGSSAHILTQVAKHQHKQVYAFTRKGDRSTQEFARQFGAVWAGDSDGPAPKKLDAAILFAPDGSLVPHALRAVEKGGCVVCAGIHMSDIPSFPYSLLWEERVLRSVSNLTRRDGREFLELAPKIPIKSKVTTFPLAEANEALQALRLGKVDGSIVLVFS